MTAFVGGGANIAWGNDDANNLYNEGLQDALYLERNEDLPSWSRVVLTWVSASVTR